MAGYHRGDASTRPLGALGHPARLGIVQLVVEAGRAGIRSGSIARAAELSPSATSQHLALLTDVGLLVPEPVGRTMVYRASKMVGDLLQALDARLRGMDDASPFARSSRTDPGPRTTWHRVAVDQSTATKLVLSDLKDGSGQWFAAAAPPYNAAQSEAGT